MGVITVKLLYGASHGEIIEVADYVQVIRKPLPVRYASLIPSDPSTWDRAMKLDEYVIHRLPSGSHIGIHTSVTLAEVIDRAIDRL